jgi:hypothetical protein
VIRSTAGGVSRLNEKLGNKSPWSPDDGRSRQERREFRVNPARRPAILNFLRGIGLAISFESTRWMNQS